MSTNTRRRGRPGDRRTFLRTVAGAGAFAGLAGCLGGAPGGQHVTIEYVDVAGVRSAEIFEPAVEAVAEATGRRVELDFSEVPYGDMKQTLLTRLGGGNAPDVAAIDQIWLGEFVDGGSLMAIDEVADAVDFDDFIDAFADPVRSGGHVYGTPTTTDVRGMYWDKRQFESTGLDPEAPPETWAELLDVAETLHDPPETYGAAYMAIPGRWTVNLFAAGGTVLGPDGEPRFQERPGVSAATLVDDLYNEPGVSSPSPVYSNGARLARQFLDGQYAIDVVEGSWLDYFWRNGGGTNEEMVERFGFAPTPHPAGGEPATMSGGHVLAGFEGTDHPDVVREFLRVVAGREFQRHLATASGSIPTRASLVEVDEVWEGILYADTVREMLSFTHTRPVRHWSTAADALERALQEVAFDRADPEPALSDAAERVRSATGRAG